MRVYSCKTSIFMYVVVIYVILRYCNIIISLKAFSQGMLGYGLIEFYIEFISQYHS